MIKSLNIFSKKYVRTFCSNDPVKYYMRQIKATETYKETDKEIDKETDKEVNIYNDRED